MAELKTQNEKPLTILLLVALVPTYLSIVTLHGETLLEMVKSQTWRAYMELAALGIGPLVCLKVILQLLVQNLDTHWKERLAHLRWNHPLPGSRADKLIRNDPRIDIGTLDPEIEALLNESMTPRERNSHWYNRIYRPVRETPAVSNTHRRYLLYREASAGAFMVLSIVALSDAFGRILFELPLMTLSAYLVITTYVLLLIGAASKAGNRMVIGAIANYTNTQLLGDA